MRALTAEEMDIVAGGDSTFSGTSTVTGSRSGTHYVPLQPGGGGSPGVGGSGGGGVSGATTAAKANVLHKTKGGHTYIPGVSLSLNQTLNLDKIVDYGFDHSFTTDEIKTVANEIYKESTFNENAVNGDHLGLGQYDQGTWDTNKELGDIGDPNAQIAAVYHDMHEAEAWYQQAKSTDAYNINESGLNFQEYFNIKHNEGRSGTDWQRVDPSPSANGATYVQEIDRASSALNLH